MDISKEQDTTIKMFAPCGMNCTVCYKHCRKEHRHKPCGGCLNENEQATAHCRKCGIRDCVQTKGIAYCFQCFEFPCQRIKNLDRNYNRNYGENLIENSEIAREKGILYFIDAHTRCHRCADCGGIISLHDSICSKCGKNYMHKKPLRK